MNLPRPYSQSPYMDFSKMKSAAKYNLATSGILNCTLAELDLRLEDFDLHGANSYGYMPLLEAIGRMKGVAPECVVRADGTSMANHLAMSALFAPGDEVLIEEPTYELVLSTALYLGAKVNRFQRRAEENYALNLEEIASQLTPKTRLIVVTNMHNPTSVQASQESLRALGELADSIGARVLVDEVYLECLHDPPVPSSIHFGKQFVVTSSLTKAWGLSGLRCGWILAEPELAERMWQLNDLFSATSVFLSEALSVAAIAQIDKLTLRADTLLEANRKALVETLGGHPAIELDIPPTGTTVFPRLRRGNVAGFCEVLREKYETSVAPGVYFERPEHFRVGIPGEIEMTREGLLRLAAALDEWRG